jgi:hypothetical protein
VRIGTVIYVLVIIYMVEDVLNVVLLDALVVKKNMMIMKQMRMGIVLVVMRYVLFVPIAMVYVMTIIVLTVTTIAAVMKKKNLNSAFVVNTPSWMIK